MMFQPDTPPSPPPYPPPPHVIFANDATTTYQNDTSNDNVVDMEIKDVGQEQLEDILYWHFGYNWDGVLEYVATQTLMKPWRDIQMTLSDIESYMDERHRPTITTFVGHLVHNKAVPSALWDLNDANPLHLHGHSIQSLWLIPLKNTM